MSRSLLLASLALFVIIAVAPSANAATTLTLTGLPSGTLESKDTQAVAPFRVTLSATQFSCIPGPANVVVALAAVADGNANGTVAATVSPSELTFTIPSGQGVASAFAQSLDAVVTLRPNNATGGVAGNVKITAAVTSTTGCTVPGAAASGTAEQAFMVKFSTPDAFTAAQTGEVVPGFEMPLLLVAVAAALFVARRNA